MPRVWTKDIHENYAGGSAMDIYWIYHYKEHAQYMRSRIRREQSCVDLQDESFAEYVLYLRGSLCAKDPHYDEIRESRSHAR